MAITINVKKNNYNPSSSVDRALKKLKRIMADEGVVKELKDRRYYLKPSEKKRRKAAEARSRVSQENRMKERGII